MKIITQSILFGFYFVQFCMLIIFKYSLICSVGDELKTLESLQFKFATIESATNKFSHVNEIGKGGFGVVYKVTQ
jgi:hypothetical protein